MSTHTHTHMRLTVSFSSYNIQNTSCHHWCAAFSDTEELEVRTELNLCLPNIKFSR